MPKISQQFSITFRIGDKNLGQFAKVGVQIDEIDTTFPIEGQITECKEAMTKVWAFVLNEVDNQVEQILHRQ